MTYDFFLSISIFYYNVVIFIWSLFLNFLVHDDFFFRSDLLQYLLTCLIIQTIYYHGLIKILTLLKVCNYKYIYTFRMLKMYAKKENLTDVIKPFTTNEWKFDNSNTRKLWTLLNQEDRKTFQFNFEGFDWRLYIRNIVYGIRKHILHEDLNNITKALSKHRKYKGVFFILNVQLFCSYVYLIIVSRLFWLHHLCICFFIYIVLQICWTFVVLPMLT